MSSTFLTKVEVVEFTGRKTKSKQLEHLRTLGIVFWVNALGAPVVPRSSVEGRREPTKPVERAKVIPDAFRTGAGTRDWEC